MKAIISTPHNYGNKILSPVHYPADITTLDILYIVKMRMGTLMSSLYQQGSRHTDVCSVYVVSVLISSMTSLHVTEVDYYNDNPYTMTTLHFHRNNIYGT